MTAESEDPSQRIISLYWSISPAALRGVLDQIRTALTQLVAELRATMSGQNDVPTADVATQAVHVVVTGKRSHINVTAAQASGTEATATAIDASTQPQPPESGFWTRSRKIGAFVVGLATIVGTALAIVHPSEE